MFRGYGPKLRTWPCTAAASATRRGYWASARRRGWGSGKKTAAVSQLPPVHPPFVVDPAQPLRLCADELWSFVRCKKGQRWRWWVEDAATGQVPSLVFGRRTHATFRRLLAVLRWVTDAWQA